MRMRKIGFIGGCIINPRNITRNQVFYSVVNQLLRNENHEEVSVVLGNYENYSQLHNQTQSFITKKEPDIIYLFIRPFPLLILNKVLIKYDISNFKTKRTINPFLFKSKLRWDNKITDNQIITNYQTPRRSTVGFQDINLFLGSFLGLNNKSTNYIFDEIDKISKSCRRNQIKLVVILPPQYHETLMSKVVCKKINNKLLVKLKESSISNINIYDINNEQFENDRIHFNTLGHRVLAKRIFDNLISNKYLE